MLDQDTISNIFRIVIHIQRQRDSNTQKFRNAFSSKFLKIICSHNAEKVRSVM